MPWVGMAATLGWNYSRHRRHKSTLCSATRSVLPPHVLIAALGVGIYVLARHLLDGYPR